MTTALATSQNTGSAALETTLIGGDLSKISPDERLHLYKQVCQSLGLNPLTRPFEYITLNGKLTLYARKDCTDQLRSIRNVSIDEPRIEYMDDSVCVTVTARTPDGRTDSDVGFVSKKDMQGNFGNVVMKAVTKAKRRVTLSICGLGMLDETEIETIPNARPFTENPPAPKQLPQSHQTARQKPAATSGGGQPSAQVANAVRIASKLRDEYGTEEEDLVMLLPEGVARFEDLTPEQAEGVTPNLSQLLNAKIAEKK